MSFRNRSRRGNALRPVNRIKHVVVSQFAGTAGTEDNLSLITANDNPVIANVKEVETGSIINGIYLKVEAVAVTAAALANYYIAIFKNPGGNLNPPPPNAVGSDDNKKFVIHQEMVMFQQQANSNPRTVFNGVIVIPRGYRRFGPNDTLNLLTLAPGVNTFQCVQCHYKEFR